MTPKDHGQDQIAGRLRVSSSISRQLESLQHGTHPRRDRIADKAVKTLQGLETRLAWALDMNAVHLTRSDGSACKLLRRVKACRGKQGR